MHQLTFLLCMTLLLALLDASIDQPECLVSSYEQLFNQTFYFNYPFDIYTDHIASKEQITSSIRCHAHDIAQENGMGSHFCPLKPFCPLFHQNIVDSVVLRNSRLARSSLCVLRDALMNKSNTVNVYVSGGSVTVGSYAGGCCPADGCAARNSEPCTWSHRFVQWLNVTFPARVNILSIAQHGFNSAFMAEELETRLRRFNATPFTSNDLVLLDHSVNDNVWLINSGFAVESGLEMLIRRVYLHSIPHSFPTLVILDADPKPHKGIANYPYYEAYEKVGRYYDIPVWSYRDAVLSNYSRVNQSQYNSYLNFSRNADDGRHPSWHLHLFMADLYAGILMRDTNEYCDLNKAENRIMYSNAKSRHNRTVEDLPVPLSANASLQCEKELLSLSYDIVTQNLNPVGQYRFEPERGGWNLTVDKVGRPGGFIVTEKAVEKARLVFTLNITTAELVDKKIKFQLMMHYLRSYDNGGQVYVSMCSRTAHQGSYPKARGILDGLWSDYITHHYSLPDRWAPHNTFFTYETCKEWRETHPTIEVTFHHLPQTAERGIQKLKLMSIKVCQVEEK